MANDRVLDQLDTLLGGRNDNGMFGNKPVFEQEMFDKMYDFIVSLEPDQLTEEQANDVMGIIEEIEIEYEGVDEDEDDLDEAPKRVKRNRSAARKGQKPIDAIKVQEKGQLRSIERAQEENRWLRNQRECLKEVKQPRVSGFVNIDNEGS